MMEQNHPRYPETRRAELLEPLGGTTVAVGAINGLLAGAAMMLFYSTVYWALGAGFSLPAREIACVIYGIDALVEGGHAVAMGLIIHGIVSAAWGILFSSLLPRGASNLTALWAGLIYSVGVWGVMTYGVLPWGNEYMRERVEVLPEWHLYSHLVYGFCLLAAPSLRRRLRGGTPAARRPRNVALAP